KAYRVGVSRRYSQSRETDVGGRRQDLSILSLESADACGSFAEQPRQGSGCLHYLPQDSCQRTVRPGGAQNRGRQRSVRYLSYERLEPVSEAFQAPAAGGGDVLRGLPQSAWDLQPPHAASVRSERSRL